MVEYMDIVVFCIWEVLQKWVYGQIYNDDDINYVIYNTCMIVCDNDQLGLRNL